MLLGAVVPAREREDQGVLALDLAELASTVLVIGQFVVWKGAAWDDVAAHELPLSLVEETRTAVRSTRARLHKSRSPFRGVDADQ